MSATASDATPAPRASEARSACPLCEEAGGRLVAQDAQLRVVRVEDTPEHPAYYRVIWHAHVAEWTELTAAERAHVMDAVALVEQTLRRHLVPAKINLASLGNQVPHLHWHVVARFTDDAHFPAPIWAAAVRVAEPSVLAQRTARLADIDAHLAEAFEARAPAPPDSAAAVWPVPPG